MGWIENRRSGLWCQSRSKHSIFVSRESEAWPMVGPESVASELIDVVALERIADRPHKVNNYNSCEYLQKKGDLSSNCKHLIQSNSVIQYHNITQSNDQNKNLCAVCNLKIRTNSFKVLPTNGEIIHSKSLATPFNIHWCLISIKTNSPLFW